MAINIPVGCWATQCGSLLPVVSFASARSFQNWHHACGANCAGGAHDVAAACSGGLATAKTAIQRFVRNCSIKTSAHTHSHFAGFILAELFQNGIQICSNSCCTISRVCQWKRIAWEVWTFFLENLEDVTQVRSEFSQVQILAFYSVA